MPGKSVRRFALPILSAFLASLAFAAYEYTRRNVAFDTMTAEFFAAYASYAVSALLVIGILYIVSGRHLSLLRFGTPAAPARAIRLLGVEESDNWRSIGMTLGALIVAVTAILLYVAYSRHFGTLTPVDWGMGVVFAIPLAALQAAAITTALYWAIAQGFSTTTKFARWAPFIAALIAILPGYLGAPGGFLGAALMAFTAWLATRSIQDTGGIAWALIISFLQYALIFTTILAIIR